MAWRTDHRGNRFRRPTATQPITDEELQALMDIESNPLIQQLLEDMANAPTDRDRERVKEEYRRRGIIS